MNRDNFTQSVISTLSKRAAYICSNPDCKCCSIAPATIENHKIINIGVAAHITAAIKNGPRYDSSLSKEQRISIDNAIFLCSNCAAMIDKNNGNEFPTQILMNWKDNHDNWVRSNLNKKIENKPHITQISVTSTNQTGGITAGIINLNKPQRLVDDNTKLEIT